jgi:heme-degrading monooxygenase HmoA
MFARVTRSKGDPAKTEELARIATSEILPSVQGVPGFKGMTVLADRKTGEGLAITFWASEEEMKASEDLGQQLRADAIKRVGGSVTGVERFEVIAQG